MFFIFIAIAALAVAVWSFMSTVGGEKKIGTLFVSIAVFIACLGIGVGTSPSSSGKKKETKPSYSYNDVKDIVIQDYWEEILK